MKTYKEQAIEVNRLVKRINKKSNNFAIRNKENAFYGDLGWVIEELKNIDSFLNNKYL